MGSLSGMSGVSVMLTLSLVTLIAMECLKTNNVIENFEELGNSQENFGSTDWNDITTKTKKSLQAQE